MGSLSRSITFGAMEGVASVAGIIAAEPPRAASQRWGVMGVVRNLLSRTPSVFGQSRDVRSNPGSGGCHFKSLAQVRRNAFVITINQR